MSVHAWIKLELGILTLTDTQSEVEDAEPNVQPEEEDDVGNFTEQEQVSYVLLQRDWEKERRKGEEQWRTESVNTRSDELWKTLQL